MCEGASLDPGVAEGLTNFGFSLLRGYGLTETAPLIAATPDFDKQRNKKFKSVGAVIPSGKLKIGTRAYRAGYHILPARFCNGYAMYYGLWPRCFVDGSFRQSRRRHLHRSKR